MNPIPPSAGGPTPVLLGRWFGPVVLLLLALLLCKQWLFDPAPFFSERDAGFSAVSLNHLQHAMLGRGGWADAPLGWPFGQGTARADWMAGQALLLLPAHLAGVDPSRIYELASLVGVVLTAWAGHQLARFLVGPGPHTILAGLVAGFGPLQLGHVAHANLVHHQVALVPALLLGVGFIKARAGLSLAGGLAAGFAWHFGLYMGLHAALVTGVVVLGLAVTRQGTAPTWAAASVGLAVSLATVIPVAMLYSDAATVGGIAPEEMLSGSWDLGMTLALTEGSPLHMLIRHWSPVPLSAAGDSPNPGFIVCGLALVGLVAGGRPRGAWILVLGVALLAGALALGSTPQWSGSPLPFRGPHGLLESLTGGNLRSPIRWFALVHVAMGLYAAAGLAVLAARLPRWRGLGLVAALTGLAASELPLRPQPKFVPVSAAYCMLDNVTAQGALFESFGSCACSGTPRLRAALFHGRPVVAGYYARQLPLLYDVNRFLEGWPQPGVVAFLRATQSTVVLEHPPLRGEAPSGATCEEAEGHRLCVLSARAPVPAPSAVTTVRTESGSVVGLRWPSAPLEDDVTVTCQGRAPEIHPTEAWKLLARVRNVASFDVFLETPCAAGWEVSEGTPEPLYLDPEHSGDTWLPPMPVSRGSVAEMLPEACAG